METEIGLETRRMTGKQLAFTLLTIVDGTGTIYTNPWVIPQLFYLSGAIRENPRHYSTSTVSGSTKSEACRLGNAFLTIIPNLQKHPFR